MKKWDKQNTARQQDKKSYANSANAPADKGEIFLLNAHSDCLKEINK